MTAPVAPLTDLICPRCGWGLVDDVKGAAWEATVTRRLCPCQTLTHADRTRAEAAQRAENADRYAFTDRARQREAVRRARQRGPTWENR